MPEVFGRETELDALRCFVDRVPDGLRALTLAGEAGIGKTALWSAGIGYVLERAFRTLTCRSAQSEAELSFAGLADVLAEVPEEALESLPHVQRSCGRGRAPACRARRGAGGSPHRGRGHARDPAMVRLGRTCRARAR